MFWQLILAHFIADYPLQTNRLVKAKRHLSGLIVHVAIHFVVTSLILARAITFIWPYILLLVAIHFGLDFSKSRFSQHYPQWVTLPYLIDQALHLTVIYLISQQINLPVIANQLFISHTWAVYLTGCLLVSHVWFVTERIIVYQNPAYQKEVIEQFWPRLTGRVILLNIPLVASYYGAVPLLLFVIYLPYFTGKYRLRAALTDVAVAVAGWIFIEVILRYPQ